MHCAESEPTHYDILEVEFGAAQADIRVAYRRLALKHHPDKDKSDGAKQRFQKILHAYEILFCVEARQLYDSELAAAGEWQQAAAPHQDCHDDEHDVCLAQAAFLNPELCRACRHADFDEIERLLAASAKYDRVALTAAMFLCVIGTRERHCGSEFRAFCLQPCLKILLDAKADPCAVSTSGASLLTTAARGGVISAVCFLIECKADVHLSSTVSAPVRNACAFSNNNIMMSALMHAAERGHARTVRVLLDANAFVDDRRPADKSALMLAALGAHEEAVEDLLAAGADVNARATGGCTPLCCALAPGAGPGRSSDGLARRASVVQSMLDHKAKVCLACDDGATPIWFAAKADDLAVVQMLLEHKANPMQEGPGGRTAIDAATSCDIRSLLVNGGVAKVPASHADECTCLDVFKTLLRHCCNTGPWPKRFC